MAATVPLSVLLIPNNVLKKWHLCSNLIENVTKPNEVRTLSMKKERKML